MSHTTNSSKYDEDKKKTCGWLDAGVAALMISGMSFMLASIVGHFRHAETRLSAEEMELRHWKLQVLYLLGLTMWTIGFRLLSRDSFRHKSTSSTVCLCAIVVMAIGVFLYMAALFAPPGRSTWHLLQLVGQVVANGGYAVAMVVIMALTCSSESVDGNSEEQRGLSKPADEQNNSGRYGAYTQVSAEFEC